MGRVAIEARSSRLEEVAQQVPRADDQPAGTRVVVFADAKRGWLGKLLARDAAPLHVLCSALLARGYVNVGAGHEEGRVCAWGDVEAAPTTNRSTES